MPAIIEIKDGKHQGELGAVIEEMPDGRLKTLTLEGDIHYYDRDGKEITQNHSAIRRRDEQHRRDEGEDS